MRARWCWVLAALAVGCVEPDGDGEPGDGGAGGAPPGPASLESLPARMAGIFCRAEVACEGKATPDCEAAAEGLFRAGGRLAALRASIAAGRLRLDEGRLGLCLSALERAADRCAPDEAADSGCDAVFLGLVGEGGECIGPDECAEGLWCDAREGRACGAGVCVAQVEPGGACDDDDPCPGEQTCVYGEVGRCADRVGEGAVCGYARAECAAGLRCAEPEEANEGVCRLVAGPPATLPGAGAPCVEVEPHCARGHYCHGDPEAGGDGVCRARLAAGAECPEEAWDDPCAEGHYCVEDGRTERCAAVLAAGDACDLLTARLCGPARYCGPGGRCVDRAANGEPCPAGADEACFSERCADGRCAAPDPCDED